MLIMTRKPNERVMVGDDITVTILGVKGNQVRIGIDAPRDVSVHREEIYERIRAGQREGATAEGAEQAAIVQHPP